MAQTIEAYLAVPGLPVTIEEIADEAHLNDVIPRIVELGEWLRHERTTRGASTLPLVRVSGSRPHGSIAFRGRIEGRQLDPFVQVLRALGTGEIDYDTPATPQSLREVERDVRVTVAVSPTCPHCPAVAAAALRLACASPRISVEVVRADQVGGFTSVPTVLVDDEVVSRGAVGEYAMAERIAAIAERLE